MLSKFNKKFLMSMGIDQPKSELIEFLIEHESFDQFEETEHFYYWFYKTEQVLSDNFGFINKGPYIFKKNDKEFIEINNKIDKFLKVKILSTLNNLHPGSGCSPILEVCDAPSSSHALKTTFPLLLYPTHTGSIVRNPLPPGSSPS